MCNLSFEMCAFCYHWFLMLSMEWNKMKNTVSRLHFVLSLFFLFPFIYFKIIAHMRAHIVSLAQLKGTPALMGLGIVKIRGLSFSFELGVMNFRKYLGNIFVTAPIWWSKILWPPSGATIVKKHVTPMRIAWKICILELFHWTKFSLKFVAIQ